jgi:hypothetical protein
MTVRTGFPSDRTRLIGCACQPASPGRTYCGRPVIISRMRIPTLTLRLATSLLVAACASSGPRLPSTVPSAPAIQADTQPAQALRRLTLSAGNFRYSLIQNTTIQTEGSADTARNSITTRALLLVSVTPEEGLGYRISITVDSIQLTADGQSSFRLPAGTFSLGRVLEASFQPSTNTAQTVLPDSLCTYGQFVTAAHDLLLLQLPAEINTDLSEPRIDSARGTLCRAGTRIEMVSTRQVRETGRGQPVFDLASTTELGGSGLLGRDSIHVSGSIATQGTVSFTGGSRLPWSVETTSQGLISVRLRDSTTVFRQASSQRLQKEQTTTP